MNNLIKWIKGTGVVAWLIAIGCVAILVTSLDFADIPAGVWTILAGLGFGVIRTIVNEASKNDNKGWKSYLAAAGLVIMGVLETAGIEISDDLLKAIDTTLGGFGVFGIADSFKKIFK